MHESVCMHTGLTGSQLYRATEGYLARDIESKRDLTRHFISYQDWTKELVTSRSRDIELPSPGNTLRELDDLMLKSYLFTQTDFLSKVGEKNEPWFNRWGTILGNLRRSAWKMHKSTANPLRHNSFTPKPYMQVSYEELMGLSRQLTPEFISEGDSVIVGAYAQCVFECPEVLTPSFRELFETNRTWRHARATITSHTFDNRRTAQHVATHKYESQLREFANTALSMMHRKDVLDQKRIARGEQPFYLIAREQKKTIPHAKSTPSQASTEDTTVDESSLVSLVNHFQNRSI